MMKHLLAMSAAVAVSLVACGGGDACSKDADCKGTRVCKAGECVDTSNSNLGAGSAGAGSAGAGSAGAGSSGAGSTSGGTSGGSCDKDTDCSSGNWCNQHSCQASSLKRVGEQCVDRTECAGTTCIYRNPNDVSGYCSKQCNSFTECPTFWSCGDIANGAGKRCLQ